jgi:hypothetical protein
VLCPPLLLLLLLLLLRVPANETFSRASQQDTNTHGIGALASAKYLSKSPS